MGGGLDLGVVLLVAPVVAALALSDVLLRGRLHMEEPQLGFEGSCHSGAGHLP